MRPALLLPAVPLIAVLSLTGCASSPGGSNGAPPPAGPSASRSVAVPLPAGTALVGTLGTPDDPDDYSIGLTTVDGTTVTALEAGDYTITVDDRSGIHNFHLTGEGVDEATEVDGKGEATFDVTLAPGTYTYRCDPHSASMSGSITVS